MSKKTHCIKPPPNPSKGNPSTNKHPFAAKYVQNQNKSSTTNTPERNSIQLTRPISKGPAFGKRSMVNHHAHKQREADGGNNPRTTKVVVQAILTEANHRN